MSKQIKHNMDMTKFYPALVRLAEAQSKEKGFCVTWTDVARQILFLHLGTQNYRKGESYGS